MRGVGLFEQHALGRQCINVGRINQFTAVSANIADAQIVSKDKDDVRLGQNRRGSSQQK